MFAHAATEPGIDQQLNPIRNQREKNKQSTDGEGTDSLSNFQTLCERQNVTHRTMDVIIDKISTMGRTEN